MLRLDFTVGFLFLLGSFEGRKLVFGEYAAFLGNACFQSLQSLLEGL